MKSIGLAILAMVVVGRANPPERLLNEAKFPLGEALAKAAPALKESAPVSAKIREVKGRVVYVVGLSKGEETLQVSVDAKTSEIVEKVSAKKSSAALLAAAKIGLPKAIELALAKKPGKASGAEVELEDGKVVIGVKIVADGKAWEVEIDGVTGAVLEVEEDDDDDEDDADDDD